MMRIAAVSLLLAATLLPALSFAEGFESVHVGGCVLEYPGRNSGAADILKKICNKEVFRIFDQLGADTGDLSVRNGAVRVRIVEKPQDMDDHAPDGVRLPAWSGAIAFPSQSLILLPLTRRDGSANTGFETTLLHELSHIAFHRAANGARVPRWFSEGVAILQSERTSIARKGTIWWASMMDTLPPLSDVEHYPEGAVKADRAYAMAADFTAHIIEQGGWSSIRYLLKILGEGELFDPAFDRAFGMKVARAEADWRSRVFSGTEWLAVVTGTSALWGAATVLFVMAWIRTRERKRRRLAEMAKEEAPLEQVIRTLSEMTETAAAEANSDETDDSQTLTDPSRPRRKLRLQVRVDGRVHTLH